jgi:uncharacterized protein (TIGR03437 family)
VRSIFTVFLLGSTQAAFAGITYTCDPNIDQTRAGTCAYLNSTIAGLYSSTFSNANASIYIQYGSTGLGLSYMSLTEISYREYLNALTSSANASGNTVQVAAVKALNSFDSPLYGTSSVVMTSALAAALGFGGLSGVAAGGTGFCAPPGTPGCFDGIVTITNQTQYLYFRSGTEGPDQADFFSTAEHETDEVLGTASCIVTGGPSLSDFCGNNVLAAVDLFRYQSAGNLVLISTTPGAYFSYDGGRTNGANGKLYNTLNNGEDYADFTPGNPCQAAQSVQDAEGCAGGIPGLDITNDGGAEINILNAIGYIRNVQPANPVISSVLNAATGQPAMAASTYVAIYGAGLSTTNPGRTWTAADFGDNGNGTLNMPTNLDGTSVTVNGTPAYVYYISPTQLNIITPTIAATGNGIPVIVSVNDRPSAPFSVTLLNLAPSFFEWSPYLVAQHASYANVGKLGLFPSAPANFTTPAKPGETILLYGTGFGPTSPAITAGIETDKGDYYLLNPTPTATLGSIPANVSFAGLVAGDSQVYQFNVTIPSNAPNGDLPLVVNVNGTLSLSGLITVQH